MNTIIKSILFGFMVISITFNECVASSLTLKNLTVSIEQDTNKISKKVKASFPGGEKALYKFIGDNLKFPEKSISNYMAGRVIVEFTISKEGTITNPNILVGLDQFCDKEVLRIVSIMPQWNPATLHGEPIDSKIKLPVSFKSEHAFRKNEYFLDSKTISEKEFNKLKPLKIKTLLVQREEFVTKMSVYTFKILKGGILDVQNIVQKGNQVTFDVNSLPENGVLKAELLDGNGMNLSTKMVVQPLSTNRINLDITPNAKKPIFISVNQLGTTLSLHLAN